jgi:uncharacterized protein YjbJ (UPF0337 family)
VNNDKNRQDPYDPDATKGNLGDRGTADQTRGKLNQAGGKVRQAVGNVTGKKDLRRKGQRQGTKGNLQETAGSSRRNLPIPADWWVSQAL